MFRMTKCIKEEIDIKMKKIEHNKKRKAILKNK